MKVILESFRFLFISIVLLTFLGGIAYLTYSTTGVNLESYDWILVITAFILTLYIFKKKGWGKVYHKTFFWTSLIMVIFFSILIPEASPSHLHATKYVYAYGFPFKFLNIYVENGSKFLIPNLFSQGFAGWHLSINFLGNFLIFYFALRFLFKKRNKSIAHLRVESFER